jgi:hypothetical protein
MGDASDAVRSCSPSSFFSVEENLESMNAWVVSIGDEHVGLLNALRQGQVLSSETRVPIEVSLAKGVLPFAVGFQGVPVVARKLAQAIQTHARCDVQIVPAELSTGAEDFVVLNVLHVLDAHPDSARGMRMADRFGLPLRRQAVLDHHIFRVKGALDLIVCPSIRVLIESQPPCGVVFTPVSTF